MAEPLRWATAHGGSCDFQCEHASCRAWQIAGGHCLLCTRPLPEVAGQLFAHRSNGTGASHISCRLNQLASRQPVPRFTSEGGEFQIAFPTSDEDAESLRQWEAAARRFLAAVKSVTSAYDSANVVPLPASARPPGGAS